MAINYRLKYVMAMNGLHGPFNTKAEASQYAEIMGIEDYDILDADEAQRLNEPEEWAKLHPKGHTKS